LAAIGDAYATADEDRKQLERSLHVVSEELYERNRRLESELDQRTRLEQELHQATLELYERNHRLESELEERARLELELRLAEKLRAVGQLAAGIAHEINTPVQFIGDSLRFLDDAFRDVASALAAYEAQPATGEPDAALRRQRMDELYEQLDIEYLKTEVPKAVARCVDGTQRVAKIVRALKTLAHPDAATQELADINAAIENTLVVVANEVKYCAQVTLDLQASRKVRCHIGEVQQVLLNLLVNAAHAIQDKRGDSEVFGNIKVCTQDEGEEVVIRVSDDGAGIPEHVQSHIFEPFFTTKPVGKGSGQGLPIARTLIVERHGGKLSFESVVGEGTTFTVRLPVEGRTQQSVQTALVNQGAAA
jgi:signal transduction histidine kinase